MNLVADIISGLSSFALVMIVGFIIVIALLILVAKKSGLSSFALVMIVGFIIVIALLILVAKKA